MQRYFLNDDAVAEQHALISGSDYHHIKNVMRLKVGDKVIVTLFSGRTFKAKIDTYTKKDVILKIVEDLEVSDNTLNVTLAQALIKREPFELVLQKATELGVKGIYPINTERSIIKIDDFSKKKQRYESIVKEASEQSERAKMPVIHDLIDLMDLPFEEYNHVFLAYERHDQLALHQLIGAIPNTDSVLVIIGPEGGFCDQEIEQLKEKTTLISLGNTILRSETAAIYILSVFRYLRGE